MSKKKEEAPKEEIIEEVVEEVTAEEVAESKTETADDLQDKLLRLTAEYDNFRKRTAKEKEDIGAFTISTVISSLLPVLDNFDRAIASPCGDEEYKKGFDMISNQFAEFFTRFGLEEIPALGEKFDPNFHNAVMKAEDDEAQSDTVIEVFAKGYKIGDKIVRHAMVKVAQ